MAILLSVGIVISVRKHVCSVIFDDYISPVCLDYSVCVVFFLCHWCGFMIMPCQTVLCCNACNFSNITFPNSIIPVLILICYKYRAS